jgi:hypothetical protein
MARYTSAVQRVVKMVSRDICPLTAAEAGDLARYEAIISKGWDTFIAVGEALAHIRDKRLYRAHFQSFDAYCRYKWHYRKAHAYRLIGAAEVMQVLSPIGDISMPRNEAQVRPLMGLKADEIQTVWRKVLARAGRKPVTATLVKKAVTDYKHRTYPKLTVKRHEAIPREISDAVRKANKLLFKVKRCMRTGDLAETMILIHGVRQALQFPTCSN